LPVAQDLPPDLCRGQHAWQLAPGAAEVVAIDVAPTGASALDGFAKGGMFEK